jgi:hypothetical protein
MPYFALFDKGGWPGIKDSFPANLRHVDKHCIHYLNMFSGFWSLLLTIGTVVIVSLFTKPKTDEELKDLVYGLTPLPDEGSCPWYKHPVLWAAVVGIVLVEVNIIFW